MREWLFKGIITVLAILALREIDQMQMSIKEMHQSHKELMLKIGDLATQAAATNLINEQQAKLLDRHQEMLDDLMERKSKSRYQ
jgi:hypothetical protein